MFGLRPDGKKVKKMGIIDRAEPFFMPQRNDATNYTSTAVSCAPLDDFIARERKKGNTYSYMHIMFGCLVRLLYLRPKLNRFIMRGTVYQRNKLTISMDIKQKLEDDGESETLKFEFTGRESIAEVKQIVDTLINDTLSGAKEGDTSGFIKHVTNLPSWCFRWFMAMVRWLDKHGLLPNSILKASPFHTSVFLTNLKSIKLPYIYHHLYNFGTTTLFIAMGKERMMPVVENNKDLKVAKMLEIGITMDERVADGYYMGKSLRLLRDMLANPDCLLDPIPEGEVPTKIKKKSKKKKATKVKKVKTKKTKSRIKKSKIKLDQTSENLNAEE